MSPLPKMITIPKVLTIPNRINPALSDRLSPEKIQALVDVGYMYLLELIDLLNETMWGRVQEDGWTKANERLLNWLRFRIKLLPEWERRQLLQELDLWGDCPYDKEVHGVYINKAPCQFCGMAWVLRPRKN